MLTAPLTVLNIRWQSVDYVNSPSHSFKHKVSINILCNTIKGYFFGSQLFLLVDILRTRLCLYCKILYYNKAFLIFQKSYRILLYRYNWFKFYKTEKSDTIWVLTYFDLHVSTLCGKFWSLKIKTRWVITWLLDTVNHWFLISIVTNVVPKVVFLWVYASWNYGN